MPSDSPGLHQRLVALIHTSGTPGSPDMPDGRPAIVKVAAATPPLVHQHA